MIVGILGLIGSGKDTVANRLVESHGYVKDSFAATVKDTCSVIFGWQRDLLEGDTIESREWRDTIDTWWAAKLHIPHFTPRWALQHISTDVMRNHFNPDIWISALENRIRQCPETNFVISDARFVNEITKLRHLGAKLVEVRRGARPEWFDLAHKHNYQRKNPEQCVEQRMTRLKLDEYGIHQSEWDWIGTEVDIILENNMPIDVLYGKVDNMLS